MSAPISHVSDGEVAMLAELSRASRVGTMFAVKHRIEELYQQAKRSYVSGDYGDYRAGLVARRDRALIFYELAEMQLAMYDLREQIQKDEET